MRELVEADFAQDNTANVAPGRSALALALQEAERRFRAVTETSLQGKLVHRRYRTLFANAACLEMFGFESEAQIMAEPSIVGLLDLDTQVDPDRFWQRCLTEPPTRVRQTLYRRDGSSFVADVFRRMVMWDDEPAIVLAVMDASADEAARRTLLFAKAEAEAARRARRKFLSAASHELRTPLHAAMGRLQLLQAAELNEPEHRLAEEALRSCRRLLHNIEDVLDSAALEVGQLTLASETFRPAEAVAEAVRLAAAESRDSVSIDHRVEGAVDTRVIGDERRVRRVALALLEEAMRRQPLGPITLVTDLSAEGVSLVVRARCLRPGSQDGDRGGAHLIDTMGIARAIANAMGGVLVANGSEDGVWTITSFFPLEIAAPPAQMAALRGEADILVVDDHAGNRRLLASVLTSLGHTPYLVESGAEALALVTRRPFDLVLMDLAMPGMDGFEAARRIRALDKPWAHLPIAALTASAAPGVQDMVAEAGMDAYLQKPVELPKLAAAINLLIGSDAITEDRAAGAA